ncbi:hypothetical protein B9Q04_05990, partial [Candidatus Marsarchaeota G2 archaeon BE_D]
YLKDRASSFNNINLDKTLFTPILSRLPRAINVLIQRVKVTHTDGGLSEHIIAASKSLCLSEDKLYRNFIV